MSKNYDSNFKNNSKIIHPDNKGSYHTAFDLPSEKNNEREKINNEHEDIKNRKTTYIYDEFFERDNKKNDLLTDYVKYHFFYRCAGFFAAVTFYIICLYFIEKFSDKKEDNSNSHSCRSDDKKGKHNSNFFGNTNTKDYIHDPTTNTYYYYKPEDFDFNKRAKEPKRDKEPCFKESYCGGPAFEERANSSNFNEKAGSFHSDKNDSEYTYFESNKKNADPNFKNKAKTDDYSNNYSKPGCSYSNYKDNTDTCDDIKYNNSEISDSYKLLGVKPGASLSEISKVYRDKIKLLHPDRNTSKTSIEKSQKLSHAYTILKTCVDKK